MKKFAALIGIGLLALTACGKDAPVASKQPVPPPVQDVSQDAGLVRLTPELQQELYEESLAGSEFVDQPGVTSSGTVRKFQLWLNTPVDFTYEKTSISKMENGQVVYYHDRAADERNKSKLEAFCEQNFRGRKILLYEALNARPIAQLGAVGQSYLGAAGCIYRFKAPVPERAEWKIEVEGLEISCEDPYVSTKETRYANNGGVLSQDYHLPGQSGACH